MVLEPQKKCPWFWFLWFPQTGTVTCWATNDPMGPFELHADDDEAADDDERRDDADDANDDDDDADELT